MQLLACFEFFAFCCVGGFFAPAIGLEIRFQPQNDLFSIFFKKSVIKARSILSLFL